MRTLCCRCLCPESICYCASVRPIRAGFQLVILQHPLERKRTIGTARMAHLSVEGSKLIYGTGFKNDAQVNALISDPHNYCVVLYPGPQSRDLGEGALELGGRRLVLFVIDGTWACAKSMINRSPNLLELPQVRFAPGRESEYRIRLQPQKHCLSTLEAVHQVIGLINRSADAEQLMVLFRQMVERQLEYGKKYLLRRTAPQTKDAAQPVLDTVI